MATYKKSFNRERLLGCGGNYGQSTDVDFDEEDIWTMSSEHSWTKLKSGRVDPARMKRRRGGLSMTFDEEKGMTVARRGRDGPTKRHVPAASAPPMNVPVRSGAVRVGWNDSMNLAVELDQEERDWDPPHVYLARVRESMTMSVFEGVGRTLKGRDLSRVRDAVWSKTGFFG